MVKKKYVSPLVKEYVMPSVYLLTYSSDLSEEDATGPAKSPLFVDEEDF